MLAPYVLLALAYPDTHHESHALSAHHASHSMHTGERHTEETDPFAKFNDWANKEFAGFDDAFDPTSSSASSDESAAPENGTGSAPTTHGIQRRITNCADAEQAIAGTYKKSSDIRKQKMRLGERMNMMNVTTTAAKRQADKESTQLSESLDEMSGAYEKMMDMMTKMKQCLTMEGGCNNRQAGAMMMASMSKSLASKMQPWSLQVNRTNNADTFVKDLSQKQDMLLAQMNALDQELAELRIRAIELTNCEDR